MVGHQAVCTYRSAFGLTELSKGFDALEAEVRVCKDFATGRRADCHRKDAARYGVALFVEPDLLALERHKSCRPRLTERFNPLSRDCHLQRDCQHNRAGTSPAPTFGRGRAEEQLCSLRMLYPLQRWDREMRRFGRGPAPPLHLDEAGPRNNSALCECSTHCNDGTGRCAVSGGDEPRPYISTTAA